MLEGMNDTIAAVSTPLAGAGLGVVRISGAAAVDIAERIFDSVGGRKLSEIAGYTALFGHVHDTDGVIDECVALRFAAPHSYTGDDTVELSCHGGVYILRRVLRAAIAAGARQAEAGEFTRRAFLNGKLDLSEAESVMNLIGAQSREEHAAALAGRQGAVYEAVTDCRDRLVSLSADIAAWVDFPDEDVPYVTADGLVIGLREVDGKLERLIAGFESGRLMREGIDTAIVGKPNVGKSTVMNLLVGCRRSIVTDVAGTTRDVIEESVMLGEVKLRLSDTAGLHDTADEVERIGVDMADSRLRRCQLAIAVFDGSRALDEDDRRLLSALDGKPCVAIINKADLPQIIERGAIEAAVDCTVTVAAGSGLGTDEIAAAVAAVAERWKIDPSAPLLQSEHQRDCCVRCREHLSAAIDAAASGVTIDAVGVCISDGLTALAELTGECVSDSVIDDVFSRFCVGK